MPNFKKETQVRDLVDITRDLGEADATQKLAKKDRDKGKDEFFAAANVILAQRDLARKTVTGILAQSEHEAQEWATSRNPGWVVQTILQVDAEEWSAILEEDPQFLPFVYVNQEDKKVYSRSIREGSLLLDDERLAEDNHKLYELVTEVPGAALLYEFIAAMDLELEDEVDDFIAGNERFPRVLKSLDDLSQEQIDSLQPYVYPGPKTAALNAPRKAKEEELG